MDSRDSSPRSLDATDTHHHHRNPSFDDQPKVKLMCSYGGRIQPRPHHNHLTYVAGDTKILAVDRHIKFSTLAAKLSSLSNSTTTPSFFKYQLPGEDLDALISVTNDEDLHHMMIEYDRLSRASPRPARLRLFLFPLNNNNTNTNFPHAEPKPEPQWFIDALNSVHVPLLEGSPPPPPNPDFLFGFDKSVNVIPPNNISPESNYDLSKDNNANNEVIEKLVPESEPDFEHEIHELKRMYIGNNEQQQQQQLVQRKSNEENGNGGVYGVNNGGGDGYAQKINNAEKVTVTAPLVAHSHAQGTVPGTVSFLQERNNAAYSLGVPTTGNGIYLIQTPSGIFQAVRPVTGPVGQPVYLVHAPSSEVSVGAERGYAAARGGEGWM